MAIGDFIDKMMGSEESGSDMDFEEEFEEDSVEEEFEGEEEEVTLGPWDTAYQFAEDMLSEEGFADMKEFIDKAMMHRIDMSPLYRDRIESGVSSMNMITESMKEIQGLRGEMGEEQRSYSEYVDEIKAANTLINEIDRLGGEEERIVNEMIGIARDVATEFTRDRSSDNIRTSVETTDEEI